MITNEQIRPKLQEAIRRSGMTQTEIAKKLNIYQSAVQQYLSGRAMPALDTFANLCAVLDLDPADILCLSEDNAPARTKYNIHTINNSGKIDMK